MCNKKKNWRAIIIWYNTIIKLIKIYKNKNMFIPTTFKLCIIKSNNITKIIAFNEKKTIKTHINNIISSLQIDTENNILNMNHTNVADISKWSNILNNLLFAFNHYFFKKIKFKGKGFRLKIKKQKKICKFLFGHSHTMLAYIKNIKIQKCTKYKFNLKSVNKINLQSLVSSIIVIKPNNVYTNRGIREGRQIIFRRKGKKGSYN